jgi:hypothetical protein
MEIERTKTVVPFVNVKAKMRHAVKSNAWWNVQRDLWLIARVVRHANAIPSQEKMQIEIARLPIVRKLRCALYIAVTGSLKDAMVATFAGVPGAVLTVTMPALSDDMAKWIDQKMPVVLGPCVQCFALMDL